jgi:Flp pilus assembly protein TadG
MTMRVWRRLCRKSSARRGGTMVEFVLVALELFVVVFACLEFGRAILVYTSVANAARVGLRYAIVHGIDRSAGSGVTGVASQADICNVVVDYTKGSLLNGGLLSSRCGQTSGTRIQVVWPDNGLNTAGSRVQVTVVYNYDPFFTAFPKLKIPLGTTAQGIITY